MNSPSSSPLLLTSLPLSSPSPWLSSPTSARTVPFSSVSQQPSASPVSSSWLTLELSVYDTSVPSSPSPVLNPTCTSPSSLLLSRLSIPDLTFFPSRCLVPPPSPTKPTTSDLTPSVPSHPPSVSVWEVSIPFLFKASLSFHVLTGLFLLFPSGVGGIFASLIYRQADYPRYIPGLWATIGCQFGILTLLTILSFYFRMRNKQADRGERALEGSEKFRYTL